MENFRFHTPTEVVFGKNAENDTGKTAKKYGSRALLVFGKGSVIKSGLLGRVEESLKLSGMEYREFGGAKPNPTLSHVREGIKEASDFKADIIIGIGGGSALDTAKAIAHGTANPDKDIWDIWTGKEILAKTLPVGAVITIPAAGSEMSDSAVITNEDLGKKAGLNTDFNRCCFAIMNPELGMTLPKSQLSAGVTDILMHTLERYFIPDSHCAMTDEIAEGLMRTVIEYGKKVVEDPKDYDALCEIFWASSLSHNGITNCGRQKDFSVHKFGHALSARYDVTHGDSLSAVWGAWALELYKGALERFSKYARRVWGAEEKNDEKAALFGIEKTVDFFRSIHMPVSLHELGVEPSDEDLKLLSLDATKGDTVKLSKIRPLDAAAVEKIYRAAL